jgi:hypothetical protein
VQNGSIYSLSLATNELGVHILERSLTKCDQNSFIAASIGEQGGANSSCKSATRANV